MSCLVPCRFKYFGGSARREWEQRNALWFFFGGGKLSRPTYIMTPPLHGRSDRQANNSWYVFHLSFPPLAVCSSLPCVYSKHRSRARHRRMIYTHAATGPPSRTGTQLQHQYNVQQPRLSDTPHTCAVRVFSSVLVLLTFLLCSLLVSSCGRDGI